MLNSKNTAHDLTTETENTDNNTDAFFAFLQKCGLNTVNTFHNRFVTMLKQFNNKLLEMNGQFNLRNLKKGEAVPNIDRQFVLSHEDLITFIKEKRKELQQCSQKLTVLHDKDDKNPLMRHLLSTSYNNYNNLFKSNLTETEKEQLKNRSVNAIMFSHLCLSFMTVHHCTGKEFPFYWQLIEPLGFHFEKVRGSSNDLRKEYSRFLEDKRILLYGPDIQLPKSHPYLKDNAPAHLYTTAICHNLSINPKSHSYQTMGYGGPFTNRNNNKVRWVITRKASFKRPKCPEDINRFNRLSTREKKFEGCTMYSLCHDFEIDMMKEHFANDISEEKYKAVMTRFTYARCRAVKIFKRCTTTYAHGFQNMCRMLPNPISVIDEAGATLGTSYDANNKGFLFSCKNK